MTDPYELEVGDSPLLVSIPHDGHSLAPGMERRMSVLARSLPDTDWHVRRLYEFVRDLGASLLAATYSRYVVDLNRPPSDVALYQGQVSTGICPSATFAGDAIYLQGNECTEREKAERVRQYWQPYHDCLAFELDRIRDRFGYALLWDAHSIRSEIPNLFDGTLPDLNIGTNSGASCHDSFAKKIVSLAQNSDFSWALNGRFKGGYITRAYGDPSNNIHAMQLELGQSCYMNEEDFRYDERSANGLIGVLKEMLVEYLRVARSLS